jgi:MFS family permease
MSTTSGRPIQGQERRDLQAMFFFFGLGIMSLVPRLPDIKANLDVSTSFFGVLVSIGSVGALISHLTMGHIIHRVGVYKVVIVSSAATYLTMGLMVETKSPWVYLVVSILSGISWASYHIAINAQALHRQSESGDQIIPMLHGLWSAGAVTTAFIGLLVSSSLSLNWHIFPLIIFAFFMQIRSALRLRPVLLKGTEVTEDDEVIEFSKLVRSFSIDWVVSLGFLCSLLLEMAMGDWSTIIARQEFGVSKSLAVIPYFLFMLTMIFGRLGYSRFKGARTDKELVQPFVVLGGSIFLISLFLGLQLKEQNLYLGYGIFCIGALLTGFGISFVAPLFFTYASARSNKPGGVVVAELGAVNQALTFLGRLLVAFVAGAASLPIAMIIPAVMLIMVTFFVSAASRPKAN